MIAWFLPSLPSCRWSKRIRSPSAARSWPFGNWTCVDTPYPDEAITPMSSIDTPVWPRNAMPCFQPERKPRMVTATFDASAHAAPKMIAAGSERRHQNEHELSEPHDRLAREIAQRLVRLGDVA